MEKAAAAGVELLWSHDAVPVVDEGVGVAPSRATG